MNRMRTVLAFLIILWGCEEDSKTAKISHVEVRQDLTQYVNPFIGTGGHGHTFPGVTMPFGMVQLSPDTRLQGWDGCSGYHYSDSIIYGFSHTHLSGTGVSDYGDVLLMPTTRVTFNNGADGNLGYGARFSHGEEEASAGYYRVKLATGIEVELTATLRAGIHSYRFPSPQNQFIVLDLEHRDKLLEFKIEKISDTSVEGLRHSEAWAKNQRLFYHISFSHPIKAEHYNRDDNPSVAVFEFDNPQNQPITVKVGISPIDQEGARKNLEAETANRSFEQLREKGREAWQKQLSKIAIEEGDHDRKTTFYTALYHTMIAPNLYQDVDGRYRGMDKEVHQTDSFAYYTVFSLWDTYRATHPLFTIIERERTEDFINTMLAKYQEGGIIPIWDLSACYTGCMIGYHGIPVIADAYLKGIVDYDAELAFEAMKHSATRDHLGLKSYKEFGFIPVEEESESVSKTLEYAYDDWCIAQMAKALGKEDDYQRFIERAQSYKNVYDPSTGFMRGRFRNSWFDPFDPYEVNFNYTEANAWQYSLYAPHDLSGHIELMGGKKKYKAHLDRLFSAGSETAGRHQADITGLIGQYAHGNEPSHHMAYLYNFVGRPDKTQEKVHEILTTLYSSSPDGISGNEDCGQMSAWYVFSALGFYPVTPGTNEYIIGSPLIEKATIHLENGNYFTISAPGAGTLPYIKSASLNGKKLKRTYLKHEEITEGGTLVFELSSYPTEWGKDELPVTAITDHLIVTPPFISEGKVAFKEKSRVALGHMDPKAELFFRWQDQAFEKYVAPIEIEEAGELTVYAEKDGSESVRMTTSFNKIDPLMSIELGSQYANEYNAGGDQALIDGIRGTADFRTGAWQGYQNQDVVVTVDLGRTERVSKIETSFLRNQGSWIFLPTEVELEISTDGERWVNAGKYTFNSAARNDSIGIEHVWFDFPVKELKKIRLKAKTVGDLPEWHLGYEYGGTAWIFVDEIAIHEKKEIP